MTFKPNDAAQYFELNSNNGHFKNLEAKGMDFQTGNHPNGGADS